MPIKLHFIYSLLLIILSLAPCSADDSLILSQAIGKLITAVVIDGNEKTRNEVIQRELEFKQGELLSESSVQNSLRKLKNLRIFDDVFINYHPGPDDSVQVQVSVSDRWTIIPIAKAGGGGGSQYFTVGVYDVNSFGRHLEVGAQYQNINSKNGGVFWFRNPRLMGQRLLLGVDIWHFRLNQPFYADNGDLTGAYNNTKNRLHAFIKKQFSPWLFFGGGLDVVADEFDNTELSDEQISANNITGFLTPSNTKQNFIELNLQLSELNYDKYVVDGVQLDVNGRFTSQTFFSEDNSAELTVKGTYFKKLAYQQNIGINVVLGHTTSSLIQNQFYLGGLFEVRGYVDRRFQGSNYWRSNLEYRIPSYRSRWFVLQHVAFFDFGRIANSVRDLSNSNSDKFSSMGTGLRFISPKIYRFNARLDLARTLGNDGNFDVSFGLQQFF